MRIFCDGSSSKYMIYPENGRPRLYTNPKGATHNESEYLAVISALFYALQRSLIPPGDLEIITDSQLVVRQLNGIKCKLGLAYEDPIYGIKDQKMGVLAHIVEQILKLFHLSVAFKWVPREDNLAGQELDRR